VTSVEVEDRIVAPLADVWGLVGDFTGFLEKQGLPCTSEGSGIGMTRTLSLAGNSITERLEELDEDSHRTSYSIVRSSLPLRDYKAWIELTADGDDATRIRWWGRFEPNGTDEQSARNLVSGVYRSGIAGIRRALGVPAPR
jgi:hypothetical protein